MQSVAVRISLIASLVWGIVFTVDAAPRPPINGYPRIEGHLDTDSITRMTYDNNLEILAARYDLSVAQLDFERFEKELSEFTPLLVESGYDIDRDRRLDSGISRTEGNRFYKLEVGMEKEFFNGSSIFVGTGYSQREGDSPDQSNPTAEFELSFPFLGSATKLRRVTSRTFEENELFDNRVDFVNEVREQIQSSYDSFFSFQFRIQQAKLIREIIDYYSALLTQELEIMTEGDRRLMESEIQSLRSSLLEREEQIESNFIDLKDSLGVDNLLIEQVALVKLDDDGFYGRHYLDKEAEELYRESYDNDAEIRVLKNSMENAELKRRLAQKGKWDIFGNAFGEVAPKGSGARRDRSDYAVGVGFSVKKLDPGLLKLSLQRADAEIRTLDAKIRRREQKIFNDITISHGRAKSMWKLVSELRDTTVARQLVLDNKEEAYIQRTDTIDNLIDARDELFDTHDEIAKTMSDLFEEITALDRASGVYFQRLGLSVGDQS